MSRASKRSPNLAAIWGRNRPEPARILYLPQNANSAHAATYLRAEYQRLARTIEEIAGRDAVAPDQALRLRLAALLHDVGHYPFSHSLEEAGLPHHETLAARHLGAGDLALALEHLGVPAADILALVQGRSTAPLAPLVSGPVDVDKLDYLSRDALACGVPYGVIDVDRLLTSLVLVARPTGPALALHEKGLSALESLVFAKYQMYRNVYWHHAVRSATAMFKRLVRRALAGQQVAADEIALATDDGLIHDLMQRDVTGLAHALRQRRLAKRALDIPAADVTDPASWPAADPGLLEQVEDRLARDAGLEPNELFLDFPDKPNALIPDVPVVRRDGCLAERSGLPSIGPELMRAARRLRVFVTRPAAVDERAIVKLVCTEREDVLHWLGDRG